MKAEAVKAWVLHQKKWVSVQYVFFCVLSFLAGLLVLFLTFWLAYGVVWLGWIGVSSGSQFLFNHPLPSTHIARLICSGVFIVLLFVQHFRTNPAYWGDYPKEDYSTVSEFTTGFGSIAQILSHPGVSANMIADILLSGPRLLMAAGPFLAAARRLRRVDETGCASLLIFLLGQPHAVAYADLRAAGWETWLGQMKALDCVQFLQHGLSVKTELREELAGLQNSSHA